MRMLILIREQLVNNIEKVVREMMKNKMILIIRIAEGCNYSKQKNCKEFKKTMAKIVHKLCKMNILCQEMEENITTINENNSIGRKIV